MLKSDVKKEEEVERGERGGGTGREDFHFDVSIFYDSHNNRSRH